MNVCNRVRSLSSVKALLEGSLCVGCDLYRLDGLEDLCALTYIGEQ